MKAFLDETKMDTNMHARGTATLWQVWPAHAASLCTRTVKRGTLLQTIGIFYTYLLPELGDVPLELLSATHEQRLHEDIAKLQPSMQGRVVAALNECLAEAKLRGWVACEPYRFRAPPNPVRQASHHDQVAYESLLRAAKMLGDRVHLAAILMGDGGLRLPETVALDRADVALDENRICVQSAKCWGKDHLVSTPRWVTMTARLREALASAQPDGAPQGRVLRGPAGEPVGPIQVRRWVTMAERAAGVELLGPHALRRMWWAQQERAS